MGFVFETETTHRHGDLTGYIYMELRNLLKGSMATEKTILRQLSGGLSHWGEKFKGPISLINLSDFDPTIIEHLQIVEPDIMLFHEHEFVLGYACVAGFPDLVVEVWSDSNPKVEREMKHNLYTTSPITEHWYLTEYSSEMECWIGNKRQPNKDLTKPITTAYGLQIDISDLFEDGYQKYQ
ncbi:MAG: Uma2 family endonuclease [Firmicutes bacterium]|nr:Uma2 family endonuclease [Bacillota bacterium]